MSLGIIKRVLILCPLSIMQSAWQDDLFRFAMHRTTALAHSHSRDKRVKAVQSDAEFVICNFDGLDIIKDAVIDEEFDLIVVDEANAYKTVSTKRWKVLNSVVKPSTWVWMLTGTPASQSPTDAYGLAKVINPTGVPKFFGSFRDMVMQKVTQFKYVPRPQSESIVHNVLQPAIRFTKEECLDLPDQLTTTRETPLTPQQQKYYDTIKKQMVALAAGEEITAVNAAGMLNKLLQISQGAVYTDTREVVEFDVGNRIDELMDIITSTRHKVLVFVPFRHVMDRLREELWGSIWNVIGGYGGRSHLNLTNTRPQLPGSFSTLS
jgi:SNF2 family DNA or RNA helicase